MCHFPTTKYLVYGLIDPRTRTVFYVGKSTSGTTRAWRHAREQRASLKCAVIKSLHDTGLQYDVTVLETVPQPLAPGVACWWNQQRNPTALADAEQWWIAIGRAYGWPLTNQTDGGEGALNRGTPTQRSVNAKKGKATMSSTQRSVASVKAHISRRFMKQCTARDRVFQLHDSGIDKTVIAQTLDISLGTISAYLAHRTRGTY